MSIPLNGRIAIIDDNFEQALPLMNNFSKKKIPYTYYDGSYENLPDPHENIENDIRILFLDINLIDNSTRKPKELKSKLISVLSRVITKKNYPYVIIYWTRQDNHKELIENDIFKNELKERCPIAFKSVSKDKIFSFSGDMVEGHEIYIEALIDEIKTLIDETPVYNYLLNWEQLVHDSTDITLQEVFKGYHDQEEWKKNANYIFTKLGVNFTGKYFQKASLLQKIKGSYNALNYLFIDALENKINSEKLIANKEIKIEKESYETINHNINTKLLTAKDSLGFEYPGCIIKEKNLANEGNFKAIQNNFIDRNAVDKYIKYNDPEISKTKLKKEHQKFRQEMRENWKMVYLNLTPLCDYAQNKYEYNRCAHGVIIASKYEEFINSNTEALFLSPKFQLDEESVIFICDFKYFFTTKKNAVNVENLEVIFRFRRQIFSEIQSKLSRHINRQGVLFLDDRI